MKYDCDVIKDLLPLYQDNTASSKSKSIVDEHLAECSSCKNYFNKMIKMMHEPEPPRHTPETEETAGYKKLAKKLRFRKTLNCIGIILILCVLSLFAYTYFERVGLDAQQAANRSHFIDTESVLLSEVEVGSYKVFFYENDDKYRTIITEKRHFLWMLNSGSFWANKTDDKVKMVGWCTMADTGNGEGLTAIPVQSYDEQVAYIEMGPEADRIVKSVPYGDTVIFAWDKDIPWNDLNAIAYSSGGQPLYKLGYEIVNNTIKRDELRWLPIK